MEFIKVIREWPLNAESLLRRKSRLWPLLQRVSVFSLSCSLLFYVDTQVLKNWNALNVHPTTSAPSPLGVSHRWWVYWKWDPRCSFGQSLAGPHGCSHSFQVLANEQHLQVSLSRSGYYCDHFLQKLNVTLFSLTKLSGAPCAFNRKCPQNTQQAAARSAKILNMVNETCPGTKIKIH